MDNTPATKTTAAVIGKRVEDRREAIGKSRRAFALIVRIPLTNYRDREMGRRDFDIPQLERISAALDVDLEHWFRDLPSPLVKTLVA